MLKIFTTLMRGAVADAEEAVFDANAIALLEQQLRDAAGSLEHSKKELACALAHQAAEQRAVKALQDRIKDLEGRAVAALQGGGEALAMEAATAIAALTDERKERSAAIDGFEVDIARLRELSERGQQRLLDLRRGLEMARVKEALNRAGANGRRALVSGSGALREAESTLTRIRKRHARHDDTAAALDELERETSGQDLTERFRAAGFGSDLNTKPADVLARLQRQAQSKAGSERPSQQTNPSSPSIPPTTTP